MAVTARFSRVIISFFLSDPGFPGVNNLLLGFGAAAPHHGFLDKLIFSTLSFEVFHGYIIVSFCL